jgi:hypothetical protein
LSFGIYRKPTDTIIPNNSCHPPEHKAAAIRFLTNRRDTYNLNDTRRTNENKVIHKILHNNNYVTTSLHKPPKTSTHSEKSNKTKNGFVLHILEKKLNLLQNYSKTLQLSYHTQHVTLLTDYFPHTTIPSNTNTKNQVYRYIVQTDIL